MPAKRKGSYIFILVVIILIIAIGYTSYSLFWMGDNSNREINSLSTVIEKVLIAQRKGESVKLDNKDINGILDMQIDEGIRKGSINITKAYSSIKGDIFTIYTNVEYKQFEFLVSSSGKLYYEDEKIVFNPKGFYIGKLPLPKKLIFSKLKTYNKGQVEIKDNLFRIDKSIVPFNIKSLETKEDLIYIGLGKSINIGGGSSKPIAGDSEKLLRDARNQIGKIEDLVKTKGEKEIIADIKAVVDKMIKNPSYSYKSEADRIKAKYNALSMQEKLDIGKAIASNMSTEVINYIKSIFGI